MSLKNYSILAVAATSLVVAACHTTSQSAAVSQSQNLAELDNMTMISTPIIQGGQPQNALPRAVVYMTNVDCRNNVAIRVNPQNGQIIYYPAPTDITPQSAPVQLSSGWLLDRQGGIGVDTRFLKYTFEEYAALPETPTIAELKEAIIPDARVIQSHALDITLNEALADTAAINSTLTLRHPGLRLPR